MFKNNDEAMYKAINDNLISAGYNPLDNDDKLHINSNYNTDNFEDICYVASISLKVIDWRGNNITKQAYDQFNNLKIKNSCTFELKTASNNFYIYGWDLTQ